MRRSFSIGLVLAAALALSSSPDAPQYDPDNADVLAALGQSSGPEAPVMFEASTKFEVVIGEAVIVSPVAAVPVAAPQMQATNVLACSPADEPQAGARCGSDSARTAIALASLDLRHALRGLDLVPLG